jgi:hypothetical protein
MRQRLMCPRISAIVFIAVPLVLVAAEIPLVTVLVFFVAIEFGVLALRPMLLVADAANGEPSDGSLSALSSSASVLSPPGQFVWSTCCSSEPSANSSSAKSPSAGVRAPWARHSFGQPRVEARRVTPANQCPFREARSPSLVASLSHI